MITIKGDGFCIKRQAVTHKTVMNILANIDYNEDYYAEVDYLKSTPDHIIININKKGVKEDAQ